MSGNFIFSDTLHKTLVTWKMTANLGKNPLNRYLGLLTDKMAGTDLETGLLNMQYYFDSTPDTIQRPEIVEIDMPLRYVLLVRDTCMADNYNFKQRLLFTELFRMIRNQKLDLDGYPFTIFHSLTGNYIDIEVGIPVHNKFTELSQNSRGIIQQQPYHAVTVKYFGSYSGIAIAYKALEEYLMLKKLSVAGPVYEEYVTDPFSVPDTAHWQTNVCIPVR
ncbi:MAG TPA: hypothetical protein PLP88_08305 [Bacteroidales bacterium]|nr:hypothetical protein [Bacteroidales bacterium]